MVWCLCFYCSVDKKKDQHTSLLWQTFILACYYLVMYGVSVLMQREQVKKYALVILTIGPTFMVLLCLVKQPVESIDPDLYGFVSMVHFDLVFMGQGITN